MLFWWLDWKKDQRDQITFLSHHIKGIWLSPSDCHQYDLSVLTLTLITWLKIVIHSFLHCCIFSLFPWKKVTKHHPQLRIRNYALLSLGWSSLHKFGILLYRFVWSVSFIYSNIYQYGLMNIYTTWYATLNISC